MPIRSAVRVIGHPQTTVVLRGTSGPPEAVVVALPREAARHTVIVAADPPLPVAELAAILADRLPVGCASIRLVLSHAGRPDVARPLSDRLRLEVVAPNGAVTLLPGGRVFVSGGDWTAYRPGQPPVRQGPRHPAPSWEAPVPPGFAATPSGLWLHGGAGPTLPPALLAIPVDPAQPTVVVGHPGAPIDDAPALADLPRAVRRRMLLVPYGPDSSRLHRVAERLAARDGGTIEVLAGVPDTGPRGEPVLTTVDPAGRRGWQPLGSRFRYRAAAAPEAIAARAVGAGDLVTEVVRAGLWLRGDHDGDADAARRVPADAHPLLVLGSTALADVAALPGRVTALAPSLPGLRLVVIRPPADGRAPQWRELTEKYGPVLAVVGEGELAALPASEQLGTGEYPLITPRLTIPHRSTTANSPASAGPSLADSTSAPAAIPAVPADTAPAGSQPDAEAAGAEETRIPSAAHPAMPDRSPTPVRTSPAPVAAPDVTRLTTADLIPEAATNGPRRELPGQAVYAAWLPPENAWAPGQVLATEGPATAVTADIAPHEALVLVWSISGRPREYRAVEFPADTRFRVLAVDGPATEPSRVLLRELAALDDRSDDAVRESLRRLAAARRRATASVG
ncbi:hypothetical protein [Actinoplanes sp. NBRC 103695]|uniref:hypothetical protein n=1 Tax=Actinoplanes sp. NBRC 103695 TaxID=3032202 RepID=UPI00255381DA|nr:hypothetical protein [Actinoplanes sp. NBRC 103695]